MTKSSNIKPITGHLTVGKIAYKGYGFASNNWWEAVNEQNSHLDSSDPKLTALGEWSGLVVRYEGLDQPYGYPYFCKLYVNNSLVYVGKRYCRCGCDWVSYPAVPNNKNSLKDIFCERNQGRIFKIRLEFYDEL